MKGNNRLYPYYMVIPALLVYLGFFIVPTLAGLGYSMTDWTIGKPDIQFVGVENFIRIAKDSELRRALYNTFLFAVVTVIFKNGLGLLFAVAFNVKFRTSNLFRTIAYLPAVMSTVVIGLIFVPLLHPDGIFNRFWEAIGLGFMVQNWLVDPDIVMFSIAGVSVWQMVGYHMTIYLAGLQTISTDYYESAEIDGASAWKKFYYITLPMLAPSITINLMLSLISGLKVFGEVYALTNGGPGNASQVMTTEVLKYFGQGRWGMGTALNIVLVLIVAVICIPLLRKMRAQEVTDG